MNMDKGFIEAQLLHLLLGYLASKQYPLSSSCLQGFRYKGTTKGERAYGFFVEKGLTSLLPAVHELPFAVRVDMDILSHDGAAADTAFNSAALALQNAKIPLAAPVAGLNFPIEDRNSACLTQRNVQCLASCLLLCLQVMAHLHRGL